MGSVIFVHGTGVRAAAFAITFAEIERRVRSLLGMTAIPCYWGTPFGVRLLANGASIPQYAMTLAPGEPDATALETTLWRTLYDDPLFELRVLGSRQPTSSAYDPTAMPPQAVMDAALARSPTPTVSALLAECNLEDAWQPAVQFVRSSRPYAEALTRVNDVSGEVSAVVARALVASAAYEYRRVRESLDDEDVPSLPFDGTKRDALCRAIVAALGGDTLAPSWLVAPLRGLALRLGTAALERKRGAASDTATPAAGDVLRYQVRGDDIRRFVRETIESAPEPRVVIAHSLGGIACVDLFTHAPIDGVQALITVASQAPYLYEIDSLHGLRWHDPLPRHFPRWINVYDLRDFLSYVGADIFPGRVVDVKVDNGQPFPESHGAYWYNDDMWRLLKKELER